MSFSPPAGNIKVLFLLQIREGHRSTTYQAMEIFLSPHYNHASRELVTSTSSQRQIIRSARKFSVDIGGWLHTTFWLPPGVCEVEMHRERWLQRIHVRRPESEGEDLRRAMSKLI